METNVMMCVAVIAVLIIMLIVLCVLLWKQQKELSNNQKQIGRVEELEKINLEQKNQNAQLTNELNETKKLLDDVTLDKTKLAEREKAIQEMQAQQKKFIEEQNQKFNAIQESASNEFKKITEESRNLFKTTVENSIKESKSELESRNNELYSPLKKQLDDFNTQVGNLKTQSALNHADLRTAINKTLEMNDKLGKEAHDLTEALKLPKMQGNWGETILENVFATAGLQLGQDYEKQFHLKGDDNSRQFVDFVVNLPQGKKVAIDSKMSINAFKNWANADNEEEKQTFLKEHIKAIRDRIDELSAKDYQKKIKDSGLDFIFMFIPIEYAYFVATQADPTLYQYAKERHISIVTVSNLFAIVQVVDHIWRIQQINENTDEILKLGSDMKKRVELFQERMEEIHKKIGELDESYNDVQKSLTGNKGIIKTAQKLEELSQKSSKLKEITGDNAPNDSIDPSLLNDASNS